MKILKSFRKTITLRVDKNGEVIVKAPHFTTQKTIESFVKKHENWIIKRQDEIKSSKKSFNAEEKLFFMGDEFEIVYTDSVKKIKFKGNDILIPESFRKNVKEKLTEFYKKEAKDYIEIRLENIAALNDLEYSNLKITSAKTRWGSCTSKKTLNFTFRLIMSPADTIDYVIIHELAHLRYMNHSKKFRIEVEKMSNKLGLQDYKKARKWLKENGEKISYV